MVIISYLDCQTPSNLSLFLEIIIKQFLFGFGVFVSVDEILNFPI